MDLDQARQLIDARATDYNTARQHSSLGYAALMKFRLGAEESTLPALSTVHGQRSASWDAPVLGLRAFRALGSPGLRRIACSTRRHQRPNTAMNPI
jgi:hypothetical protein